MQPYEKYIYLLNTDLYDAIDKKHLWLVHSTDIYNEMSKQSLQTKGTEFYGSPEQYQKIYLFNIEPRPALHNSINFLITPFTGKWTWDCRPYIFVAPMSEYIGELYAGVEQDFLTLGPHTYSNESFLLVPMKEKSAIRKMFPGLQSTIVGYDYDEKARYKEGDDCGNYLASQPPIFASTVAKSKTPREAVNALFNELREKRGINVWEMPKQLQYKDFKKDKSSRIMASTVNRQGRQIRVNKDNYFHDVNSLLSKSFEAIVADEAGLLVEDTIKLHLEPALNALINNDEIPTYFLNQIDTILNLNSPNSISTPVFNGETQNSACLPATYKGMVFDFHSKTRQKIYKQVFKNMFKPEVNEMIEILLAKIDDYYFILFLLQRLFTKHSETREIIRRLYKDFQEKRNPQSKFSVILLRILYTVENRKVLKEIPNVLMLFQAKCDGVLNPTTTKFKSVPNFGDLLRQFRDQFDAIVEELNIAINKDEFVPLSLQEIQDIQNNPLDRIPTKPDIPTSKGAQLQARQKAEREALAEQQRREKREREFAKLQNEAHNLGQIETNLFQGGRKRKTRKDKAKKRYTRKH